MLSAQGRDPSAARESVGRLAVTGAEQIFSLAWNSVRERPRLICGSLELSDSPLRTAAVLTCPRSSAAPQQRWRSPSLDARHLYPETPFRSAMADYQGGARPATRAAHQAGEGP